MVMRATMRSMTKLKITTRKKIGSSTEYKYPFTVTTETTGK